MMPEVITDQEVKLGLEDQNRGLESIDKGRGSGFDPPQVRAAAQGDIRPGAKIRSILME